MDGDIGMRFSSIKSTVKGGNTRAIVAKAIILTIPVAFMIRCAGDNKPVYETTQDREYLGSLYYAKSDCATCHGGEWDGQGPDAKRMNSLGFQTTAFTSADRATKTPADYFKAVTDPETYFETNKPAGVSAGDLAAFVASHKYLTYTDRARWAISNFLYSRGTGSPDSSKISAMKAELAGIYGVSRRWEIGFEPVENRVNRPNLQDLIKKASFRVQDSTVEPGEVSKERALAANEGDPRAIKIYENRCSTCHGTYGEGKEVGKRFGLNGMIPVIGGFPRVGDGPVHQKPVGYVTRDLKRSGAMASVGAFKSAHGSAGLTVPGLGAYSESDWSLLYSYVKSMVNK
jgi:mono/diheme cytochrome c family protein